MTDPLNEDEARQVRDALSRFLGEEPPVQPPTREQIAKAKALVDLSKITGTPVPEDVADTAVLALFEQPTPSAEPSVQVPVSLIERLREALIKLPASGTNADIYSDLGGLLALPARPAEPVSIADMAPPPAEAGVL